MGRTTCLALETSWSTRRTLLLVKLGSSMLRSKCSIFQTRSRWAIHQLVSSDAAALLAVFQSSSGRWGKKLEDPHSLKSNEMAQCSFQPQQPLVCDTFKN